MELNGLQIFKHLPSAKKLPEANCKKCGFPTCMAFALKVAQKQVSIDKCNLAPEELKKVLQEALKIQQHEIVLGQDKSVKIGGETVMFRHEKTFVNKTVIAITLESNDLDLDKKLEQIKNYSIDRIGEIFKIEAINLIDKGNLAQVATKISNLGLALIIETENTAVIDEIGHLNPIVNLTKTNNFKTKNEDLNICAKGKNIEEISNNSTKLQTSGFKNIVLNLDIENKNIQQIMEELTLIRRLSIIEKAEPFVYPVITKIPEYDIYKTTAIASFLMCRYSNLIILDTFNEAMLTTLYTLRQNIYTDPQKPLQVESKVYEVNDPDENSLVLMTTNFALTYFAVLSEMESCPFSSYIVITPSDGMSVLTAWSADKFTPEMAAKVINESEKLQKIKNKRILIPGLLSHIKEDLEEVLPAWEIIVGTNEAYQIQDFIKNNIV